MARTPDGRRPHGALRDEVLDHLLREDGPRSARQVVAALGANGGQELALTTVLTVLDRLHRAGEVDKHRDGGELVFTVARHDPSVVADDMLAALLRSEDRTGALLSFAGNLGEEDLRVLRRLVGESGPESP